MVGKWAIVIVIRFYSDYTYWCFNLKNFTKVFWTAVSTFHRVCLKRFLDWIYQKIFLILIGIYFQYSFVALKTLLYMPGSGTHINYCVLISKCKHQVDKVRILWEGHKISHLFWHVLSKVKTNGRFFFIFFRPIQKTWTLAPGGRWPA